MYMQTSEVELLLENDLKEFDLKQKDILKYDVSKISIAEILQKYFKMYLWPNENEIEWDEKRCQIAHKFYADRLGKQKAYKDLKKALIGPAKMQRENIFEYALVLNISKEDFWKMLISSDGSFVHARSYKEVIAYFNIYYDTETFSYQNYLSMVDEFEKIMDRKISEDSDLICANIKENIGACINDYEDEIKSLQKVEMTLSADDMKELLTPKGIMPTNFGEKLQEKGLNTQTAGTVKKKVVSLLKKEKEFTSEILLEKVIKSLEDSINEYDIEKDQLTDILGTINSGEVVDALTSEKNGLKGLEKYLVKRGLNKQTARIIKNDIISSNASKDGFVTGRLSSLGKYSSIPEDKRSKSFLEDMSKNVLEYLNEKFQASYTYSAMYFLLIHMIAGVVPETVRVFDEVADKACEEDTYEKNLFTRYLEEVKIMIETNINDSKIKAHRHYQPQAERCQ